MIPGGARVVVAPDSFKGTFAAASVADAIATGLEHSALVADRCPVADGGEGTADILAQALGGHVVAVPTVDPLGRAISAPITLLADGRRAVVETASASGLALLSPAERDPWAATTLGTGLLIRAAIDAGADEILVAVGGSAGVDGGIGALGAFEDGESLTSHKLTVLCDVSTPWERCAEVYGPQKGAGAALVERLARRLDEVAAGLPRDPRGVPMTGAAGGLSGALWSRFDAHLTPGAAYVLDAVGFERRLHEATAVVTGEGRLDRQSAMGKIVGEIGRRAAAAGVPLHAIVGSDATDAPAKDALGLRSVTEATTLDELEAAGAGLAALLAD